MTLLRLIGAISLSFLALTASVSAQQIPWHGAYFGAQIGGAWGTANPDNPATPTLKAKGALGGVHLGYDYRFVNNVVLGVVGDFSWADIKGSQPDGNYLSFHGKTDMAANARLRLGYVINNSLLIYGTGGFAWSRTTASQQCAPALFGVCAITGPFVASHKKWADGYVVGAGIDYKIPNSSWTAGLLYLHENDGTERYTFNIPVAGTVTGTTKQTNDQVLFRLSRQY